MVDSAAFSRLCYEAAANRIERDGGINTMGEKRLHMVLKRYYEPDETRHEQAVGHHIADILREGEILEVQTASLYPLKTKIVHYLTETTCRVTVVHPICEKKWVRWIDPEDGSISERRRSPKRQNAITALADLIYLCDFLGESRLSFRLPILEVDDYRLLNGRGPDRKRHSARFERIPVALLGEISLTCAADYAALLPDALPDRFTAADFARQTHVQSRAAYAAVKVLCAVGVIRPDGKEGRAQAYCRSPK